VGAHQIGELRLDPALEIVGLEVTHRDHRHQIGAVPVAVVAHHRVPRGGLDDLRLADGDALGVLRAVEQHRRLLVEDAHPRAPPQPPLLQHHPALLLNLLGVEGGAARPVAQHLQRAVDDLRLVGRDLQHVDGLVERGVGVEVGAELGADALEEAHQRLLGESAWCR
jgi:hypothetical protein